MLKESIELHRLGRLDEAEHGYREHLEGEPNDAEALHLLGLLRHQRGAKRRSRGPLDARARAGAGESRTSSSRSARCDSRTAISTARARTTRKRSRSIRTSAPRTQGSGRSHCCAASARTAERHFRIALRAGEDAQSLAGLGSLLLERERSRRGAAPSRSRGGSRAERSEYPVGARPRVHKARHRKLSPRRHSRMRCKVKPDLQPARQALGALTLKAKRPREAETHFRALLAIPGAESAGHVGLGDVARAEERHADAVAAYRAALAIDPAQSAPARALAWSLMRHGPQRRSDRGLRRLSRARARTITMCAPRARIS